MMIDYKCQKCKLDLWNPVTTLAVTSIGLYDDIRFPGRLIVALNEHHDYFEYVGQDMRNAYMDDIQKAMLAIREVTQCARVNMSILGNAEPHVHAHLIPRFPDLEEKPNSSPWDDPRPRGKLLVDHKTFLIKEIRKVLENS